jgi:hypothetical protein
MRGYVLALAVFVISATLAAGQECPQSSATDPDTPSQVRPLEGRLVFHDSLRKWFELKLDRPQCGQESTELVMKGDDWTPLQTLRGCRVRSKGVMGIATTGYYSLETYQSVETIEPVGTCPRQEPFPDYSKAEPDRAIPRYRVDMFIGYEQGDHPIRFRVTNAGTELRPWQAYASYDLTGGFVLYGKCGRGFIVDRVFGTPQASPQHFTARGEPGDMAMFDPEGAGKKMRLVYTCVRVP